MGVGHYENFPVASVLLPAHLRPAVVAIYRFARTADDYADEGDSTPPQRLTQLRRLGADLDRIEGGQRPQAALMRELCAAIIRHRLPISLFRDLLGGTPAGEGGADTGDHRHRELTWPGPGRLRLVQPTAEGPLAAWLGDRPGRLHHLEVAVDDPERVRGARPRGDGSYEIAPADACGTRIVLTLRA